MDVLITISSDSDSDVEIVDRQGGNYVMNTADPLPPVRVDCDELGVDIPACYIGLKDARCFPDRRPRKRQSHVASQVIDLTDANETQHDKENAHGSSGERWASFKKEKKFRSGSPHFSTSDWDSVTVKSEATCSDARQQENPAHELLCSPFVRLTRLSFLEANIAELNSSGYSVFLSKDSAQTSLSLQKVDNNGVSQYCLPDMKTMEDLLDGYPAELTESLAGNKREEEHESQSAPGRPDCFSAGRRDHERGNRENKIDHIYLSKFIPSATSSTSSPDKVHIRHEAHNPVSVFSESLISRNITEESDPALTLSVARDQDISALPGSDHLSEDGDPLKCSIPNVALLSQFKSEEMDGCSVNEPFQGELDNPVYILWSDESDDEDTRFNLDFREASQEDVRFVCPVAFRKLMAGPAQAAEEEKPKAPEVLCQRSLSLVYSTIDEQYPEGTLQLLSGLFKPGYYPPRDITTHLLHGILLDPQCPHHHCVHAFNLLMRTQRHRMADKHTVPWGWQMLTSVMANKDLKNKHRCEVVRMLLEYIVQTLEDDFHYKRSISESHLSIARETLSCNRQFPQVRDVINWLFSAIMKSTDYGVSGEAAGERDEQIRMVSIFQRMLSLALKVDLTPTLNSIKLSQELFHRVTINLPLRAHRMLLLETLQSKQLRCNLLEHLLDHACPVKIRTPMSLSLLLHFLRNCTLTPDPTDGAEKWQKWEELVHLLWMLLLSYKQAMKGCMISSGTEQRDREAASVYKPEDIITKPAICEAMEAFLSRSQADLGQALPLHVEESLTYLQEYLLDVCQH